MNAIPVPAVFTRYLGPTSHRGARVKAKTCSGRGINVPWDHSLSADDMHEFAARELLREMGWATSSDRALVRFDLPGDAGFGFALID